MFSCSTLLSHPDRSMDVKIDSDVSGVFVVSDDAWPVRAVSCRRIRALQTCRRGKRELACMQMANGRARRGSAPHHRRLSWTDRIAGHPLARPLVVKTIVSKTLLAMAEKLVDLPLVTKLSPRVLRILGGNPGKFTLQGACAHERLRRINN